MYDKNDSLDKIHQQKMNYNASIIHISYLLLLKALHHFFAEGRVTKNSVAKE